MNRKLALATTLAISLAFAFGGSQDPARGTVIDPGMTRAGAVSVGGWSVSENGVLTWTTDTSATVDPAYYAARSAALAAIDADLDRQVNGESKADVVSAPAIFPATASPLAPSAAASDSRADREAALAKVAADLECQINGCEP